VRGANRPVGTERRRELFVTVDPEFDCQTPVMASNKGPPSPPPGVQ
jgi:hypothetical protein